MHGMWHDMFYPDIPLLAKILRPIIVYLFLIIGMRLAGKRQLAQLNPFDLIVLLTLSNTVQNAIIGSDNSVTGGLVGAATLLAVNYIVVRFLYSHQKLERIIEGKPIELLTNGKLHRNRLHHELITRVELEAAARRQGFGSLDEVEKAVLDPGGTISFCGRAPAADEVRHDQVLKRLNQVLEEIKKLGGKDAA